MATAYPTGASARDRFVLDHRGPRPRHDPWRSQGVLVDHEPDADGTTRRVATVFLTGRECPWRCLMCDLWKHTTVDDTPVGAIAAQVLAARQELSGSPWINGASAPISALKLYNAGSFFDPRAVAEDDYHAIAASLSDLDRVVVESHPSLIGGRMDQFLHALRVNAPQTPPALEVAVGLETAHQGALERLNKKMTVEGFRRAADRLAMRGVGLRVFLLVSPPFVAKSEQDDWLLRSLDVAFASGASIVSLIPTRTGNGALDALSGDDTFQCPSLSDLEHSFEIALAHPRPRGARVLADLWDLDRFVHCGVCLDEKRARLTAMNLQQVVLPPVTCVHVDAPFAS